MLDNNNALSLKNLSYKKETNKTFNNSLFLENIKGPNGVPLRIKVKYNCLVAWWHCLGHFIFLEVVKLYYIELLSAELIKVTQLSANLFEKKKVNNDTKLPTF